MADQDFETENGADFTNFETPDAKDGAGEPSVPGEKINQTRNDEDERKIFVGGLSWETTVKDLREYFEAFGTISDCTLKTDAQTGRSRGFGFVQFTDPASVDKVVAQASHFLHERRIDPKKANPRGGREPIKKVFVGGLDPEVPEADIKEYFKQFGKIEEIDLPFDKQKNQRRAFCFITFESEEVVDKVVEQPKQTVGGKEVDVKKATPKNDQFGGYGGFGGRGGGRGGFGGRGGRGGGYNNWGSQNYDYNNYYNQGYGNYGNYNYNDYYGNYYNNDYYNQGGWGNQGYGGYGNYGGQRRSGGGNSGSYRK
jgi:squid-like protein